MIERAEPEFEPRISIEPGEHGSCMPRWRRQQGHVVVGLSPSPHRAGPSPASPHDRCLYLTTRAPRSSSRQQQQRRSPDPSPVTAAWVQKRPGVPLVRLHLPDYQAARRCMHADAAALARRIPRKSWDTVAWGPGFGPTNGQLAARRQRDACPPTGPRTCPWLCSYSRPCHTLDRLCTVLCSVCTQSRRGRKENRALRASNVIINLFFLPCNENRHDQRILRIRINK
jgi:hypothetical protein